MKLAHPQLLAALLTTCLFIPWQIISRITPPRPDISTRLSINNTIGTRQGVNSLPRFYRPMPLRTEGGGTR